jgi:hypothetical protein
MKTFAFILSGALSIGSLLAASSAFADTNCASCAVQTASQAASRDTHAAIRLAQSTPRKRCPGGRYMGRCIQ